MPRCYCYEIHNKYCIYTWIVYVIAQRSIKVCPIFSAKFSGLLPVMVDLSELSTKISSFWHWTMFTYALGLSLLAIYRLQVRASALTELAYLEHSTWAHKRTSDHFLISINLFSAHFPFSDNVQFQITFRRVQHGGWFRLSIYKLFQNSILYTLTLRGDSGWFKSSA